MRGMLFSIFRKVILIHSKMGFKKVYPISAMYNFLFQHLKPSFIIVLGHKMFLDSKDSLELSINDVYEPLETEIIKKEIKTGDVVLDLGAHIGYYTLLFARLVGENGKVFAFEPDPNNFALLKKNVEINGYQNVTLVQKAVSNKNGKIRLYLSGDNTGDHRAYDSHDGRKSIEIKSIRLDDYFKEFKKQINFIKMDIQGAEGEAIQGMHILLDKNKRIKLITEFWPIGLKRSGIEPKEYLHMYGNHGFKIYHIDAKQGRIEVADINKLLEMYPAEKENFTNLLCVKEN